MEIGESGFFQENQHEGENITSFLTEPFEKLLQTTEKQERLDALLDFYNVQRNFILTSFAQNAAAPKSFYDWHEKFVPDYLQLLEETKAMDLDNEERLFVTSLKNDIDGFQYKQKQIDIYSTVIAPLRNKFSKERILTDTEQMELCTAYQATARLTFELLQLSEEEGKEKLEEIRIALHELIEGASPDQFLFIERNASEVAPDIFIPEFFETLQKLNPEHAEFFINFKNWFDKTVILNYRPSQPAQVISRPDNKLELCYSTKFDFIHESGHIFQKFLTKEYYPKTSDYFMNYFTITKEIHPYLMELLFNTRSNKEHNLVTTADMLQHAARRQVLVLYMTTTLARGGPDMMDQLQVCAPYEHKESYTLLDVVLKYITHYEFYSSVFHGLGLLDALELGKTPEDCVKNLQKLNIRPGEFEAEFPDPFVLMREFIKRIKPLIKKDTQYN